MKKKICLVVSSAMTVNAFLAEPIKKLCEQYQVHLVFNGRPEDIQASLGAVDLIPVAIERKISPFRDLSALFSLIRIFRRHEFEAVQSVTPKAGLLAMLASFLAGVRSRVHMFTGQVWATREGISRWFFKQMDRVIALLATEVLVDSTSQRQFLLDEKVVNKTRSSVLAKGSISGVDTVRFKPDEVTRLRVRGELGIEENVTVFLFIGRLNRDKGVLDLAGAFSKVADTKSHLLIVGPDEAGMQSQMEGLLERVLERVHFVGFSAHPEVYMAAADVLCLPSYREGFGSVVIEAAAVGIPSIGSKIYGVEDAIQDGQTGLLFKAGSAEELCKYMEDLITDAELRAKLARNARERALRDFTSETLATAWLDYYRARL